MCKWSSMSKGNGININCNKYLLPNNKLAYISRVHRSPIMENLLFEI